MFDFKFDWKDELNINIESIDIQHRELFRIARSIEQLLIIKCVGIENKRLLEILCELREYASYHFYEEEKLMAKANYSKIEEHKSYHNDFKNMTMKIDWNLVEKNPYEELKKIKDNVQDWIFQHMMIEDRLMAEEIKNVE